MQQDIHKEPFVDEHIWTGDKLEELIGSPLPVREPLIEELIYTNQIFMLYAQSGEGKSVVSLCAALQASNGNKVFGYFDVPRPLKIYYILGERDIIEPAERLQEIQRFQKFHFNNIVFDDGIVGMNILNRDDENYIIHRISEVMPDVDIIFFDPLYSLTEGGLSDPKLAGLFQNFSSRVRKRFNCAIWYNNHTQKNTTENLGGGIQQDKSDPFIGAGYIKAHVNVMYYGKQRDGFFTFQATKNQHRTAIEKFRVKYDIETNMVYVPTDKIPAKDMIEMLISKTKNEGTTFSKEDYLKYMKGVSPSYALKLLGHATKSKRLINVSPEFERACYKSP
jgi:RecA-family ATPase